MRYILSIWAISMIVICSSCGYQFYYPKPQEPVLLTHASQLKINTISTASPLNGLTAFSVAYSPAQNLGLHLGIATGGGNSAKTNSSGVQTVTRRELFFIPYISAGYYKSLENNFLYEVYGGIGLYHYKNSADAYVNKLRHYNLFIQPSAGYLHKNFELVITGRFDYLNRYSSVINPSLAPVDRDTLDYKFLDYKNYLFFQPGFTLKAGVKRFKVQLQWNYSIPFNGKYRSIYGTSIDYEPSKWGIGFTFDFDTKRRK